MTRPPTPEFSPTPVPIPSWPTVDSPNDPIPPAYKTSLAAIVNTPGTATAPILGPPAYGRWYGATATVSPTAIGADSPGRGSWKDGITYLANSSME